MANDAQMPERIARIIRENLSGVTSTDPDIRAAQEDDLMRTAELIAADLCASGQQVRALEWTDLGGGSFRAFLPIFGSVRVEPYGCCDWWEVLWSMPGQCDKLIPDVFDNPDDAKAAAQAEYERRVLAALTPAPQPEGLVRALDRDALIAALTDEIGGDAYDCFRVWEAWSVQTMSEDDFVPVLDRVEEIADRILAARDAILAEMEKLK